MTRFFLPLQIKPVEGSVTLSNPTASEFDPPKTFTFDYVFGPDSTQPDVYNLAARPIIDNVLEGYNGMGCIDLLEIIIY